MNQLPNIPELVCEVKDSVLTVTMNRPDARNAMNVNLLTGLIEAFTAASHMHELRMIVLTGSGQAFCAGGDLQAKPEDSPFYLNPADPSNPVVKLFKAIGSCEVPVIARVNGPALAGGMGLVAACDLAVSTESAIFGVPESKIGLFPLMILGPLQKIMPRRHLIELCFTGRTFSAQEGKTLGLINQVYADDVFEQEFEKFAKSILTSSPTALRLGKRALAAMLDMPLDKGFEYAQLMLPIMALSEDAKEGLLSFREKRKPNWTGK